MLEFYLTVNVGDKRYDLHDYILLIRINNVTHRYALTPKQRDAVVFKLMNGEDIKNMSTFLRELE